MNEMLAATPREATTLHPPHTLREDRLYAGIQQALFQALRETLARVAAPEHLDTLLSQSLRDLAPQAPAAASAPPGLAPAAALERLSARERDVLQRLAAGDSNKLIARAFDLSPHTVKRHVANILSKLGASSRVQAAAWLHAHH